MYHARMSIFQKHPFLGAVTNLDTPDDPIAPPEPKLKPATIPFDIFGAVQIRIGSVQSAEVVEGSEKLLKLAVDMGEEESRQVLSGIAKHFAPEDLVGKQFAFVANLEPRSIMGMESQGMILAADGEEGLALVSPTSPVPPGSRLH